MGAEGRWSCGSQVCEGQGSHGLLRVMSGVLGSAGITTLRAQRLKVKGTPSVLLGTHAADHWSSRPPVPQLRSCFFGNERKHEGNGVTVLIRLVYDLWASDLGKKAVTLKTGPVSGSSRVLSLACKSRVRLH